MHTHTATGGTVPSPSTIVLVLVAAAAGHLLLVRRARRRNPALPPGRPRSGLFLGGLALLAVALLPPLGPAAHTDFRAHMAQHLLIGMYAPLALVLSAPVTLLLRALPPARARLVVAVMRSRCARVLAHPLVALALSTGSLVPLYFTPLFDASLEHPAGHWLLHAHFLLSGCLFAYVVAGPDPAPHRPGVRARLVYLGVAVAVHALVAQALYGGFLVGVHAPVEHLRQGAEIMYYGSDLAELLLAAALVTTWRPGRPSPGDPAGRRGFAPVPPSSVRGGRRSGRAAFGRAPHHPAPSVPDVPLPQAMPQWTGAAQHAGGPGRVRREFPVNKPPECLPEGRRPRPERLLSRSFGPSGPPDPPPPGCHRSPR
ncbi:cytochrome c oxidase assembly protein [Streptomyces sp. LB8]|uniref:cytochrome c oxidase assembly protein n=1 Tax=Streptomyces sp. LB8 TaxID=3042509 RepID=UPI0034641ED3